MVLQWATKRLCKFFLKRLNQYLNEEIDVEQLDVQLGSGTGRLTNLILNTGYINDQVKHLPFVLKYGSVAQILVRLPSDIELHGLELHLAPREKVADQKHTNTPGENVVSGSSPPDTNCTYLGVSDGVRIIGQMIKSLLLCLRVKVSGITVVVQGASGSGENFLKLRIPSLEYGSEDSKQENEVTKVIRIDGVTLEVGSKPFFDQRGVAGSVRVTAPLNPGGVAAPKIGFHVEVEPVQVRAGFGDVEQLLSIVSRYGGGEVVNGSIYHDAASFYDSRSVVMDGSRSEYLGKCTLPVIADWMRKPELAEPNLEASVDEFFECMDQSASSSDIWNWTRSAFGAASISGSLPEETQMEFSVTSRIQRFSAVFLYDGTGGEGLELILEGLNFNSHFTQEDSRFDARIIEINQLGPSLLQEQFYSRFSKAVLPKYPVSLNSSSNKLKLLRVGSSLEHPAGKMVLKRSSRRKGNGMKLSLSFQPIVSWIDDSVVEKLTRSLTRLQNSLVSFDSRKDGESSRGDFKLELSTPALRTFITLSSREASSSRCILVVDVREIGSGFSAHKQKGKSLGLTAEEAFLHSISGSSSSSSLLVRLSGKTKTSLTSLEMKWRANTKFGSWIPKKVWDGAVSQRMSYESSGGSTATTLGPEAGSSTLNLLKATSSLEIQVSVPRLLLDFSSSEHFEALEVVARLGDDDGDEDAQLQARQILFGFSVGEVCIELEPMKLYDPFQLRVSRLEAVFGAGLGREPGASYFRITHGEGELVGGSSELISFRASAVGRGDGGSRNALATGKAGLSLSFVSWPGREKLGDVVVAGSLKGMTLLSEAGEFDWLLGIIKLSERFSEPFQRAGDAGEASPGKRLFFLFDFQDTALRYEPGTSPSFSSVGCVLAFAALRVSSGEIQAENGAENFSVSLRDIGLHLVDTRLRRGDSTPCRSLHAEGYVQVSRSPVVGATLKLNSSRAPSWEIESIDNQLNFDTCSDSIVAFGRLVSDLQQIFAPEIKRSAELELMRMKGKSPAEVDDDGDDGDEDEAGEKLEFSDSGAEDDGLFSGLVEDAFAVPQLRELRTQAVASSSGSSFHLQATAVARFGDLDQPGSQPGSQLGSQPGSPAFIEDYVVERVTHVSSGSGSNSGSGSGNDNEASKQGWSDSEPRCTWFSSVDVIDTHVPLARGSSPKKGSGSSGYPQAIGRIVFRGWRIRWRLYGGSDWERRRSSSDYMEVLVDGMDLSYDAFEPTGLYASSLVLKVRDLYLYDCREDAPWRVIVGYYYKKSCPRESTSKAVEIHMDAVRPNPLVPLEEYRLLITLLPIRVNLDQEHVDFFIKFFAADKETDEPLNPANDDTILPFFQLCEIRSSLVRIDYIPRKLNYGALRAGNFIELLNLCSWKGVKLQLKPVHASGVYGWSSLMGLLLGQWLEDISRHQIHQCLIGAAPIRPVCAVSSGAAKLIILPAEQYKKDRRFLRGVRKGAIAFLQSVSVEALGLGANIAAGAHHILVNTEKALGGGSDKKESRRKSQPGGAREGLQQAYESIAQGLERTALSLVANPVKVYQRGGGAGVAVASAIKASPAAILAPASAAADAVRHALIGVRNGLDPERKRAYDEKHTGPGGDVKRWMR